MGANRFRSRPERRRRCLQSRLRRGWKRRQLFFAVDPVEFTLIPPVRNTTVVMTNLSDDPLRLQVSVQAWTQDEDGTAKMSPTSGVIVFPQLFTLPPKSSQRVRAAIVAPLSATEQTFRIVIEDLPTRRDRAGAARQDGHHVSHAIPGPRVRRTGFTSHSCRTDRRRVRPPRPPNVRTGEFREFAPERRFDDRRTPRGRWGIAVFARRGSLERICRRPPDLHARCRKTQMRCGA